MSSFWIVLLLATVTCLEAVQDYVGYAPSPRRPSCSREPDNSHETPPTPGDNGFRITIGNDPNLQLYSPSTEYHVRVDGSHSGLHMMNFFLVVVTLHSVLENETSGAFQLTDPGGRVTYLNGCQLHVVTSSDWEPKSRADLMWTSPGPGAGCVEFRTTVIESDTLWYKDDGGLMKVLCANDSVIAAAADSQPYADTWPPPDCCACGTAKYQLTFHSSWSHRTHPRDFPPLNVLLQWSPVVGASHSSQYTMWRFGEPASRGVGDTCEFGDTRSLEEDMRKHSSDIRTVIKMPGIRWSEHHGLSQQRWAHFSVNRHNHLLSVLSRFSPSPDWCVGVSSLNLCLANCSWIADRMVELFPWDAGTSDGVSYLSEKQPSDPLQPIQMLTNNFPDNMDSPFHGAQSVSPMAVLRIHRIHPKLEEEDITCKIETSTDSKDRSSQTEAVETICSTTSWSQWSECSVTCGPGGTRIRTRTFVDANSEPDCEFVSTSASENCRSDVDCLDHCELTHWSEWSGCSGDGGDVCSEMHSRCSRRRERSYIQPDADYSCNNTTEEEEECTPVTPTPSSILHPPCNVPADSGPCKGNFVRWHHDPLLRRCRSFQYGGCRGNENRFRTEVECLQTCVMSDGWIPSDADGFTTTVMIPTYRINHNREEISTSVSRPFTRPMNRMTTLATVTRESAAIATKVDCLMSQWSSWTMCSVTCGNNGVRTRRRRVEKLPANGGRRCPSRTEASRRCRHPACEPELLTVACQYGEWSPWSPCIKTCGSDSVQERTRSVVRSSQSQLQDATSCSPSLERRICQLPPCPRQRN